MPKHTNDGLWTLSDLCSKQSRRITAADALATGIDELLEWLEDDEHTPESKLQPVRALLRDYQVTQ